MKKMPCADLQILAVAAFTICLVPVVAPCSGGSVGAAPSQGTQFDYCEPKLLVGNIFALGPESKLLFKSERRGVRTGTAVQVTCDYTYPDGSVAARDRILYKAGQLVSFTEEELQTGEKGSAVIRPDERNPGEQRIYFEYTDGQGGEAKTSTSTEKLQSDTLVDDMIPRFIVAHWQDLERGSALRFRYIVLSRKETVGFKLLKDAESSWRGQPAVRIKMQPTSFIIAQLVDPVFFTVEKTTSHRILEYSGRTTPLLKSGNKWKELDALSVFEQQDEIAQNGEVSGPSNVRKAR
jgi:hypothetical protein